MVLQTLTFSGFPKVEIGSDDGLTILIRDRAQDDKLVKVIEPLDTVYLTYDWENNDGRLAFVKTHWPYYNGVEVNQLHKLYYGDYLNSAGETESVLLKVRQSTDIGDKILEDVKVIRTCPNCPVYDNLEEEMMEMQAINAEIIKGGDGNENGGTVEQSIY